LKKKRGRRERKEQKINKEENKENEKYLEPLNLNDKSKDKISPTPKHTR